MATLLAPASPAPLGTVPAAAADATGNYVIPNGQDVLIRVNNGSGASITVTLDDPTSTNPEGSTAPSAPWPDVAVAVPAAGARYILLNSARRARFTDPATGRVNLTYTAVTSLTVEVIAV